MFVLLCYYAQTLVVNLLPAILLDRMLTDMNLEQLKLEAQRLSGKLVIANSEDSPFVKMPESDGKIVVRILPWKDLPYQSTRIHTLDTGTGNKNFHCPRVMGTRGFFVGECPICDFYNSLWDQSKKLGETEAERLRAIGRNIKPVERYYFNVIVRGQEAAGPKILSVGKTLQKKILAALVGEMELEIPAIGDITAQKTGRDLHIVKKVKKGNNLTYPGYESSFWAEPSAIADADWEKYLASRHDLFALVRTVTTENLHSAVYEAKVKLGMAGGFGAVDTVSDDKVYRQVPTTKFDGTPIDPSPKKSNVKIQEIKDEVDDYGVGDEFFARLKGL